MISAHLLAWQFGTLTDAQTQAIAGVIIALIGLAGIWLTERVKRQTRPSKGGDDGLTLRDATDNTHDAVQETNHAVQETKDLVIDLSTQLAGRLDRLDARFDRLETRIDDRFAKLEARVEGLELSHKIVIALQPRLDNMERRVDKMEDHIVSVLRRSDEGQASEG